MTSGSGRTMPMKVMKKWKSRVKRREGGPGCLVVLLFYAYYVCMYVHIFLKMFFRVHGAVRWPFEGILGSPNFWHTF